MIVGPVLIIFEPLRNFDWLEFIAIVISLSALIVSWVMSKKNIKKMQEQLDQNIFPDIVINSLDQKIDITASSLKKVKLPLANIGLGVAKEFIYIFQIQQVNYSNQNLIASQLPIKPKQARYKYVNFLLPNKDQHIRNSLKIYEDYIKLLVDLCKNNPALNHNFNGDLPHLIIIFQYQCIQGKKFEKKYKLTSKIKNRNNNIITFYFKVKEQKNTNKQNDN
jgi:hypothetical protein